jgi:catechol 2,3-dioxygenase-like lactoylglutathione lyase family enzyme
MQVGLVEEFRLKLYPKDIAICRAFYRDTLGFSIVHEWDEGQEERGIMFDVGGTVLELLPYNGKAMSGADISLRVRDVWALWEEMKNNILIVHVLRINDWGDTSFCIKDPEGFEITFFTKTSKINNQR